MYMDATERRTVETILLPTLRDMLIEDLQLDPPHRTWYHFDRFVTANLPLVDKPTPCIYEPPSRYAFHSPEYLSAYMVDVHMHEMCQRLIATLDARRHNPDERVTLWLPSDRSYGPGFGNYRAALWLVMKCWSRIKHRIYRVLVGFRHFNIDLLFHTCDAIRHLDLTFDQLPCPSLHGGCHPLGPLHGRAHLRCRAAYRGL